MKKPSTIVRLTVYIALVITMMLINLPFFWMVITAFKNEPDVFSYPPKFYPTILSLKNFISAFEVIPLGRYLFNTLFVALCVTMLQLVFNVLAAYGLSRFSFKGREAIFMILVGTLMIPMQVILVPLYIIVRDLKILNTYWSLIIPFMSSAFGIFLLRQFFMSIPKELEDAAKIDGCGRIRILWSIILPLSKPALWTMALYTFLAQWNSYMWPLVSINNDQLQLIQVGISKFASTWETQWTYQMAASTVAVIPIIVFFFFVQKQFIEGISISGTKG
jgi:multiple sugar transport system permease protein